MESIDFQDQIGQIQNQFNRKQEIVCHQTPLQSIESNDYLKGLEPKIFQMNNERVEVDDMFKKRSQQHEIKKLFSSREPKFKIFIGEKRVGKTSCINNIINNEKSTYDKVVESTKQFQVCKKYQIIDTIGIAYTSNKGIYSSLLEIVKFLFEENIGIEKLFIVYVSNRQLQNQLSVINQFVYIYFLYELFKDKVEEEKVLKQLVEEFLNSNNFLKWIDCNYHSNQDQYKSFRHQIYVQKDKALNYIQYANSFHIFLHNLQQKDEDYLDEFRDNEYRQNFLKEKIWTNNIEQLDEQYKDLFKTQKRELDEKIKRIIEIGNSSVLTNDAQSKEENILILGKSQVGKSTLIEQITEIYGLRGNSKQSKTAQCEIFTYVSKDVKYNLIDTPGFGGNETRTSYYDNLKLIADFLRRNNILKFKILLLRDNQNKQDETMNVIRELLIFLIELFDQEVTLVNKKDDAFNDDLSNEVSDKNIRYIKKSILQVETVKIRSNQKPYFNEFELKSFEFIPNTEKFSKLKKNVTKEENENQINSLFGAINELKDLSLEDKIQLKITKIKNFNIIPNPNEYFECYEKIFINYIQLDKAQEKINQKQDLQNQIEIKIRFQEELDNKQYGLLSNFNQIDEVQQQIQKLFDDHFKNFIGSEQEKQKAQNKLKNNIQRHFLFLLQWSSYSFENKSLTENILLSRKQLHFWNLFYHLEQMIDANKKEHIQIVENLAQIKVIKEITTYQHIQNAIIDSLYEEDQEEVAKAIQQYFEAMDSIIGVGGEGFKYLTYFSYNAKLLASSFKAIKDVNKVLLTLNVVASLASIGFDIFSYDKNHISKEQMSVNTTTNTVTAVLGIAALLIPGVGWIIGSVAAAIGLIGNLISNNFFTSKEQFDTISGLFFKDLINDKNVRLLYFQKAQFLQEKNYFKVYSQPQCSEAYNFYRELEVDKFSQIQSTLSKIQKFSEHKSEVELQDKISQHIMKEIITNKLFTGFIEIKLSELKKSIEEIKLSINTNQSILKAYFNHYKVQRIDDKFVKQGDGKGEKIHIQINSKHEYDAIIDQISKTKEPVEEQKKQIEDYYQDVQSFVRQMQKENYSKKEYDEFSNSSLRKPLFPILFNTYCNFMAQKQQYLCKQRLISQIDLSPSKDSFVIKNGFKAQDFFKFESSNKHIKSTQEWLDDIKLLNNCEIFISSRYLQEYKQKKNEFSFSFCSEKNNLECNIESEIDLLDILNSLQGDEEKFINYFQALLAQLDSSSHIRIQSFYRAHSCLKTVFK